MLRLQGLRSSAWVERAARSGCATGLVPVELGPGTGLGAFLDGVAEEQFVVTGLESRESGRGAEVACGNVVVKVVEELDERVGIAFGVSAGIGGIGTSLGSEERRILDEFAVRFVAAADPEGVGIFAVPGERAIAAVD